MYRIFLSLLCVASLNAEMVSGIAIVVEDKAVSLYDIKKEMQTSKTDIKTASDILIRKKLEEIDIETRRIKVSNSEVYEDIKQTAQRNNMTTNQFYNAALEKSGLNSQELKAQTKIKLLRQKLFSSIANSKMSQPSEESIKEYYDLNKEKFSHPSSFETVLYRAKDKSLLQEKIDNPMFYAPQVQTQEQTLPYTRISPELAGLLESTPEYSFTKILPDGQGGFMSFYLKSINSAEAGGIEAVRNQIVSEIMGNRRESILVNHFSRMNHNPDIKFIRMPD